MYRHQTRYRVIYGDTDNMGVAYYGNYMRWFEMGRAEMFRALGLSYKDIEQQGYFLPVSEAFCKYFASARYDDVIVIEATLDGAVKGGLKFDYTIFSEDGEKRIAKGYTKHACVNSSGRVVRPPKFLKDIISQQIETETGGRGDAGRQGAQYIDD